MPYGLESVWLLGLSALSVRSDDSNVACHYCAAVEVLGFLGNFGYPLSILPLG